MPYDDPDPTDPMTLHGVVVETDDDAAMREMASCFIDEYLRMGCSTDRVLSMFRISQYIGPYMAYESLGKAAITEMIDLSASTWGDRRSPSALKVLDSGR
jgi:hypothetical protein